MAHINDLYEQQAKDLLHRLCDAMGIAEEDRTKANVEAAIAGVGHADRESCHKAVSDKLRQHRCRDWRTDDGDSIQLVDVLAQHSEDGTIGRAIEEIDDLAADIVDAIKA